VDIRRRRSVEFSTERALKVKAISKQPHYVGSQNHDQVAIYKRITKLGLQTPYKKAILDRMGNLVKSKNILARMGTSNNSKASTVTHYDSAPHSYSMAQAMQVLSSNNLESVRALYTKKHIK
jgi:hypothetical protein